MKENKIIIVITTTIQNKTHYVKKCRGRDDGKVLAELTPSLREAKNFENMETAGHMKDKIFNPLERIFFVEETIAELEKPKQPQPGELT